MRKTILILLLLCSTKSLGQVFTQVFVDRCTNQPQVVTANFVNGSATVAFYNRVKTFTYQEFTNGELQQWLLDTYSWWNALSPCSSTTAQTQNAQQTATNASNAANNASNAANNASSSATNAANTGTTNTGSTNTGSTNTGSTNGNNSSNNSSSGSSGSSGGSDNSSSGSSGSDSGSSGGDSGGSSESDNSGGTGSDDNSSSDSSGSSDENSGDSGGDSGEGSGDSDDKSGDKGEGSDSGEEKDNGGDSEDGSDSEEDKGGESDDNSEEKSEEEVKEEEKKEEDKEEDKKEEEKEEEKEESEEEEKEEQKEEDSEEEEEKEEEKKKFLPIQLKADVMSMQTLLGSYDYIVNIGVSRSSIYGDVSYGGNLMVWANLQQASLSANMSKVHMTKDYKVRSISSLALSYTRNFTSNAIMGSITELKPLGKYGVVGIGVSYGTVFIKEAIRENFMFGYNLLYTNTLKLTDRITYSPAFIFLQTPIMTGYDDFTVNGVKFRVKNTLRGTKIPFMGVLSNSFNVQVTKKFSFNVGWTMIKSSDPTFPVLNSFMIGSKIPL